MAKKKPRLSAYNENRRKEKAVFLNKEVGDEIENCILNKKYTSYDICRQFKISYGFVIYYAKMYNLYDKMKQNSLEKLRKTARINGKKSADTLKGVPLKPLTNAVINYFIELKEKNYFRSQVQRMIKENFGYGSRKYDQLCEIYGKPKKNPQTGSLNPMYGISPGKNAGNGIKGHILIDGNLIFFRSLLELKVFMYFLENNISFQKSKHRIKYRYNNTERTYNPDVVIGNTIFEIKPLKLMKLKENIAKKVALDEYCKKYKLKSEFIHEDTFDLNLTTEKLKDYLDKGIIKMLESEIKRIEKYLKG